MDIGLEAPVSLHSEQSLVLKHLLDGANLAVSAPTSFGKSLIIDAYIAIRKPTNALILVPTIALTDETRRRLGRKFSAQYKIVTTVDVELGERNILIFPQERAIHYCDKLEKLDLLVVDEFYKASQDSTRSVPAAARQAAIRALEDGRSAGVSIPALCAAPVAQAFRWTDSRRGSRVFSLQHHTQAFIKDVLDMRKDNKQLGGIMGAISRWFLASVLFLIIMLGWIGDSLLSVVIGRPKLSLREVYRSWKHHHLLNP